METFFWVCLLAVAYPYAIYPALLLGVNRLVRREVPAPAGGYEPTVSVILPVHNEAKRIEAKLKNLFGLDYPPGKMQIIVIGDACTDDTIERVEVVGAGRVETIRLPGRSGKAAGLNAGLARSTGDIVVFTDAAIVLERQSLRKLVEHFSDPVVGCVSGEDYIEGTETEGLYGKLELLLRREEAKLHSIAGASGCFYGQRRGLCLPFVPGMAPDFLSVLVTVLAGKRALAEPLARGSMTATSNPKAEFNRKVRTFQRGLTALFGNAKLLNPLGYPSFSFILVSHKLMRWLAPLPMIGCVIGAWALRAQSLYLFAFIGQVGLYGAALAGLLWPTVAGRFGVVRLSAFFLLVNAAALKAFSLWATGSRVEVWEPTRRPA